MLHLPHLLHVRHVAGKGDLQRQVDRAPRSDVVTAGDSVSFSRHLRVVSPKVVLEEVPALLAVKIEHRHQIRGVPPVSQDLGDHQTVKLVKIVSNFYILPFHG